MLKRGIFYIKKSLQLHIWQKKNKKKTNKKKKVTQLINHLITLILSHYNIYLITPISILLHLLF